MLFCCKKCLHCLSTELFIVVIFVAQVPRIHHLSNNNMLRRHSAEAASAVMGTSHRRLGASLSSCAVLSSYRRVTTIQRVNAVLAMRAGGSVASNSSPITTLTCHRRCYSTSTTLLSADVLTVWNRKSAVSTTSLGDTTAGKPPPSKALQFVLGNAKRAVGSTRKPMEASAAATSDTITAATTAVSSSACSPTDVSWVMCERMDFHVHYAVPSGWQVREMARENHIAIQCFPPPPPPPPPQSSPLSQDASVLEKPRTGLSFLSGWGKAKQQSEEEIKPSSHPPPSQAHTSTAAAPLHGISMNCFAYHRKVEDPSSDKLMDTFLKRFATTCEGGAVNVVRRSAAKSTTPPASEHPANPPMQAAAENNGNGSNKDEAAAQPVDWVDTISGQIGGSVCEITFELKRLTSSSAAIDAESSVGSNHESKLTSSPPQLAHGLCRAFYNSNRRFHYIMLAVVPEAEFAASERLLAHALMHFGASKTTGMATY
ncbi:Hypothetical protein, putative [Bodo saltans]|uniref:GPI-anchored surface protein n=1 Tax=Bodo saltans TaxID=75058 RepID=A0A0S4JVJ6_BODSA|nr:Hypothetical protein, putative [Bodo saltans]|eukprot:CUG93425.1 Hypothetical protein, putative [Bodo saltans]